MSWITWEKFLKEKDIRAAVESNKIFEILHEVYNTQWEKGKGSQSRENPNESLLNQSHPSWKSWDIFINSWKVFKHFHVKISVQIKYQISDLR